MTRKGTNAYYEYFRYTNETVEQARERIEEKRQRKASGDKFLWSIEKVESIKIRE